MGRRSRDQDARGGGDPGCLRGLRLSTADGKPGDYRSRGALGERQERN